MSSGPSISAHCISVTSDIADIYITLTGGTSGDNASDVPSKRRHERFYLYSVHLKAGTRRRLNHKAISDSSLHKVDGHSFKIPKNCLEQSTIFKDMSLPPMGTKGSSDEDSIVLEGINIEAFEKFMDVLYPL